MVINANLYGSGMPKLPAFLPNGLFSVSATKKVIFSMGNLFYDASVGKYKISTNQNAHTTSFNVNNNDHLFWVKANESTIHPYDTTYGTPSPANTEYDFLIFSDPAYLNIDGMRWRVLTKDEWRYLINTRVVNGGTGEGYSYVNCAEGVTMLNGTTYKGLFIFPDEYTGTTDMSTLYWTELVSKGIVFLPVAGSRDDSQVKDADDFGSYWATTPDDNDGGLSLFFDSGEVDPVYSFFREQGSSVRLVSDVTDYKYMFTKHSTFVGDALPTKNTLDFNGYTYIAGYDSVYRTNDMTTFTKVVSVCYLDYYIVPAPDNEGIVIIDKRSISISYYTPDGVNWSLISYVPLGSKQNGRYPVIVAFRGLGYVTSLTDTSVSPVVTYSGSTFYRISTRAYENDTFICVFGGSDDSIGKFTTSDGGLTWTKVDSTTLAYLKAGDNYYIESTNKPMLQVKTPDGIIHDTNLNRSSISFEESSFSSSSLTYTNGKYIVSNYKSHICVSTDGGITFCSKFNLSSIHYTPGRLFEYKNRLLTNCTISEDNGESWSRLPYNLLADFHNFPCICNGKVYFGYTYSKGNTDCTDFYILGEVK